MDNPEFYNRIVNLIMAAGVFANELSNTCIQSILLGRIQKDLVAKFKKIEAIKRKKEKEKLVNSFSSKIDDFLRYIQGQIDGLKFELNRFDELGKQPLAILAIQNIVKGMNSKLTIFNNFIQEAKLLKSEKNILSLNTIKREYLDLMREAIGKIPELKVPIKHSEKIEEMFNQAYREVCERNIKVENAGELLTFLLNKIKDELKEFDPIHGISDEELLNDLRVLLVNIRMEIIEQYLRENNIQSCIKRNRDLQVYFINYLKGEDSSPAHFLQFIEGFNKLRSEEGGAPARP